MTLIVSRDGIKDTEKIKYLGVVIDYCLNFKDLANYISKTISFKINYLYKVASE